MKGSMKIKRALPEAKRLTHTIKDDHFMGGGTKTFEVKVPSRKIEGTPPSEKALENAHAEKKKEAARKHEIVMRMAMEGKRDHEIVEATGYTRQTVHTMIQNMKRQGIDIPDRKRGREKSGRENS